MPNPRTAPALVAALQAALPGWTIRIRSRAGFGFGQDIRIEAPNGNFLIIASKDRRQAEEWGPGCLNYLPAREDHQGAAGFAKMVEDIRGAPLIADIIAGRVASAGAPS